MDILYKLLTMYDFYFSANRGVIIDIVLKFIYKIMHEVQIKIEEGKKSPFARVFELLSICIEYAKDKGDQEPFVTTVRTASQSILEKAYSRILSPEADGIMREFGFNQPSEIECFSELFEFVIAAFELNLG